MRLQWPEDRDFRILSIDGGGIRGIFAAAVLAQLEERYLDGASIAPYFDLIAGTSTGGIIALGLAAELKATNVRDLYLERGCEVFPPFSNGLFGRVNRFLSKISQYSRYRYDRKALMRLLSETFGERKFGEARTRMCIPSFDGRYGEPYIFKTPHHPDFRKDAKEKMTKVAAATAAAPTFFQPLEDGGYIFIDGGVWANQSHHEIALVDALSCFKLPRDRVRILSLGCGNAPYIVDQPKLTGGIWAWRKVIEASMYLQSHNALGQAGLLIGRNRITRVDVSAVKRKIPLDDWRRAAAELPSAADKAVTQVGKDIADTFLREPAAQYRPFIKVS